MNSYIKKFELLSTEELYAILQLRCQVFVVEQNCPYLDIDGENDKLALHLLIYQDNLLAGYCRIIPPQTYDQKVAIGRVVILPAYRGFGLARKMMDMALNYCHSHYQNQTIYVQAQDYLKDFYASLGFVAISDVYLEDNIPHIDMIMDKN